MRPVAVGDGTAALNAMTQAIEMGMPYALVLLDRRMPDADGLMVAEQIRECISDSPRVILLSSEDSTGDMARSREMGISAHLLKPVQQSELLEVIQEVMSRTTGESARAGVSEATAISDGAPPPAAVPRRVLVAEDNEFNVTLLKQLFDQKGYNVQIASNGREALELATGGTFDLLLLDIHMPEMDGFEVVQTLRKREQISGRHLPVVAFTARSGKQDRERCLAAGMDDFLSKPVQADALWAVIDRNVAAHTVEHRADANLIDPAAVLGACGGEAAILKKICQTFQTSVPNQVSRIRAALRDNDAPRLREAAHMMYGTLAAFSTVAGTAVSNLEDEAAHGRMEACVPLVERLESICSSLLEQTRDLSIEKLSH
jgi:CheY-like chemotaxis protein